MGSGPQHANVPGGLLDDRQDVLALPVEGDGQIGQAKEHDRSSCRTRIPSSVGWRPPTSSGALQGHDLAG